jgi:4-hydroxybenzoate polyprenyltransferase
MTYSFSTTLRNYAQLTRVSNAPTVVSNVLVGGAIGVGAGRAAIPWPAMAAAGGAAVLFYLGGMALNDAADVSVDRVERPGRPIPSGRVSVRRAYAVAVGAFVLGVMLLTLGGNGVAWVGLALLTIIIAYNLLHQALSGSAILMGLCRGGVYVLAAASVYGAWAWSDGMSDGEGPIATGGAGVGVYEGLRRCGPVLIWLGGVVTIYTTALTVIARSENEASVDRRRWLAVGAPVLVLSAAFGFQPSQRAWSVVVGFTMAAWLGRGARPLFERPPRVKSYVMAGVCGLSLIDAYFLTLHDQPVLALGAVGCFLVAAGSQRYLSGT